MLASDGAMLTFGMGSNHQLGFEDEDDVHLPRKVEFGHREGQLPLSVSQVAFGAQHCIMLVSE